LYKEVSRRLLGPAFAKVHNKNMKRAFYIILTGVAVDILIAPRKGSETWAKLKEGFSDWKDGAKDQVNDVVSKGKDIAGKGKVITNNPDEETRSMVNQW
jgi:gas vesicle protein